MNGYFKAEINEIKIKLSIKNLNLRKPRTKFTPRVSKHLLTLTACAKNILLYGLPRKSINTSFPLD